MVTRSQAYGPWRGRGARTVRAPGAGRPPGLTEGDADRGMAMSVRALQPPDAPLPWRAERVLGGPGDDALGRREAVQP
jgi:hypothetical protein